MLKEAPTPDHGSRVVYQRGCRCLPCRSANAVYQAGQRQRPSVLVDASTALAWLETLAEAGIGLPQAAKLSTLSVACLQRIRQGAPAIRRTTETRLLAVPPIPALGAKVSAWMLKCQMRSLRKEGYPATRLAFHLGLRGHGLKFHHARVTLRNRLKVQALYRRLMSEANV